MTRHYFLSRYAQGARPVAWVTSGAPVELLRAFGFYTVYPENHSALCGAKGMGGELCRTAEESGFSQDLCSYARIDLGTALSGRTPAGRLPRPDLLFASNNICQTVAHWYTVLSDRWGIPLLLLDTPFNHEGEPGESGVDYMAAQLEAMIPVLERVSGRPFQGNRLREALALSKETAETWGEVLGTMKASPSPMTIFDAFVHLAPVVSLRGLPVALAYYRTLLDELRQRVAQGVGGVREERKRLMWDNIAIWYKVRDYATLFAERGMNFVTATYTNAWAETAPFMDPERPLESIARTYSRVILNNSLEHRLRLMEDLIRTFRVDGLVIHSARSCKPYSVGQYDLKRLLMERMEVPSVVIEADIADERAYSEEQARTRLEAFLEGMEQ
jgi:bcr-type benzoyl-CoA reductase subunit B